VKSNDGERRRVVVMPEEKDEIGTKLESHGACIRFNCWNFAGIPRVWNIQQWSQH
jgi:hypothetical protein